MDLRNICAMYNLGKRYQNGNGVEKDEAEAVRLYKRAMHLGKVDATGDTAAIHEHEKGVEKNGVEAARLSAEDFLSGLSGQAASK